MRNSHNCGDTCDTLVCHPASTTHYGITKAQREVFGITDGLIRMSVGIESIEDILEDVDQALKCVHSSLNYNT